MANIVIGSQVAYSAVNYMDSVSFCGKTCHTVMEPEFTAYQSSPHSRVECVKCHIGPGAGWFVQEQALRRQAVAGRHVQDLSAAHPDSGAQSASGARHLRKPATGRKSMARTGSG